MVISGDPDPAALVFWLGLVGSWMSIKININGREAIPVRAIPFVTGWSMSPDMVASTLAHTDLFTRLRGIAAYHFDSNGEFAPMLPKEWDGVEAELQAFSDTLKATEIVDFESYPTWLRQSIPLLPAGVFVWKDEFISAFARAYSNERLAILDERTGDRELNWTPLIPQALREVVVEGFSSVDKPVVRVQGHHQSDDFQPLMVSLAGYWDTPFDQLPDAIKPFALELSQMEWDGLNPQQRQSVATELDWYHDPRCEPSLYWELMCYQTELGQQEVIARCQANHGVALALVDVQKRIDKILDTDRARVGGEIQRLRVRQAEVEADKPFVIKPLAEIDPSDLPDELHMANLAFRAVTNGHGKQSDTFRNRVISYLKLTYPNLKNDPLQRIATVANPDKSTGRKRRNPE